MSRKIDETGNQYGKLTVLYQAPEQSKFHGGAACWWCRCECGNLIVATGHELRRGHRKTCGSPACSNLIKNEIGNKYGKLTVIEYAGLNQRGTVLWKCKCDCGNTTIVNGIDLRKGTTQSCGCLKSKGEQKIAQLLLKNKIPFQKEKKFNSCRFKNTNCLARFDFYVNNKYIIEYDGIQHFQSTDNSFSTWNTKERLIDTKEKDQFKNQWCKKNNIPIIRIPYTHLKDLKFEDLLLETSTFIIK